MTRRRAISVFGVIAALFFMTSGIGPMLHAQAAGVLTNLEIGNYKTDIEYLRFPLDQPMPLDLIRRIVEFRVAENLRRTSK